MKRRELLLAILAAPVVRAGGGDFAVIVGKDKPRSLSKAQLKKLFSGQAVTWAGGGKASLILGPPGDKARAAALEQLAGMNESEFNKMVVHLQFVNQADNAPRTMPTVAAVLNVVKITSGSIGIIPTSLLSDDVRALNVD